ncbi:MAG: von Willebrand factor type A domain-containing protein [Chloroflexota bacterium]|nr:von Willebrand factor type A domain-containing protein [Chloroflexota bacterium]
MAPNYSTDESLGDALRVYFAAEAPSLRAPTNLWDALAERLDEPRRIPRMRRKVLAAASRYWFPTLATGGAVAAGAVLAVWASSANFGAEETSYEAAVEAYATPAATAAPYRSPPTVAPTPAMTAAPPGPGPTAAATVVERVVIKEVPVETVVEKVVTQEVIKEVAVEKVVAQSSSGSRAAAQAAPPTATRPADTTFQDYGRQPLVATADDAVSTFSLDTDRTSYQLALTWARQGYDVEPDSVRAEEWINAFDYQYAPPADAWGFSITSDLVAHPLDQRQHLVRIGFQAAEVADDRPLNVTLVLDASGSMGDGNRVDIARAAAEAIRQSLRPRDRIAVVHFTTDVIHDLTVEHQSPDDPSVVASIAQLAPHDSTNVQAGLNLGVQLAHRARLERPDATNYVILMSDGVANVDATNPFAILESAYDRDAANPLRLITVGVGINNYNDVLLEQLAQHGNGWYRYLNDPNQARATFSRANWLALSTPFADQTRAQVTWDPEVVKSWRIIGYENRVTSDASFAEDRKEFAELPSGAATTVFYEVELQEGVRGSDDLTLGKVELRWVVPDTGQSRSQQVEVTGRRDLSFGSVEADPLLRLGGIVALAADRYSSLPRGTEDGPAGVSTDLAILQEELGALAGPLGGLDAYRDFRFLLERMAERAYSEAPPEAPSGYSR